MKINKQLFEDVLSGKLKGTFVLRSRRKISSNKLICNNSYYSETHPYRLSNATYTSNGFSSLYDWECPDDIIDFIPDTNMKENELTITIPEGQEIDWQESAKQEKIVFKKKDTRPRSWEEYCDNFRGTFYYIQDDRNSFGTSFTSTGIISAYRNILPSKELAEAFLAMMQLMSLRQSWIGGWKPGWKSSNEFKYCICQSENIFRVYDFYTANHTLSFPTQEMATDFLNCFKDLLEIAKPLI